MGLKAEKLWHILGPIYRRHNRKIFDIQSLRWVTTSQASAEKLERKVQPSESFVMNMFLGETNIKQVFPFPYSMTDDERETVRVSLPQVEKFMRDVNDPFKNEELGAIEKKSLDTLKELGAFGMQVPIEYGGMEATNAMYTRFVEVCGGHDLGLGIILGAHQSIGFKGITLFGNTRQKTRYLPPLSSGEKIAAFALTEPGNGSDAFTIKTRANLSEDGKFFYLNGSKIWTSNGAIADVFTVFAQVPVKDSETGIVKDRMSAFIVERKFPGFTTGKSEKKMGIKASTTAELHFDNCRVPYENLLGEVGQGFKIAMEILNNGRFGMAAALSGTMRQSIAKAVDFAKNRVQFGRKINTFGDIQEKLARMAMLQYATESMAYLISTNMDMGSKDYHLEAAISKIYSSEAAWHVADTALQVHGGMGYMSETGLEKVLRDVRIFRIFEGANDVLRLFVALTGLQYVGGHLKELQTAMRNPAANLGLILGEGTKRVKRAIGVTPPQISKEVHPKLEEQGELITECVNDFGVLCEALLTKFGKGIIEEQFILIRLANATIDIYTSLAVLSRATRSIKMNYSSAEHEIRLAKVFVNEAAARVNASMSDLKTDARRRDYEDMTAISNDLCVFGGVVAIRPIGF